MSTTGTDDLLRRAADGSPAAWSELVRRFGPMLRARAARFRLQEADAHDAVQMTWLRLAENVHRIRTPEHLGGWLATVATRECLRVVRERGRHVLAEDAGEADAAPDRGPEELAVDGDLAGRVRAAVDALPPRRRDVLLALFADDARPYAEIARDLGVPVGSLGPTRARTLRALRTTLELAGVTAA